jgi:anthranilate synthase
VARNETGLAMAVRHRAKPMAAVQIHPESILSLHQRAGHRLLENALRELLPDLAQAAE